MSVINSLVRVSVLGKKQRDISFLSVGVFTMSAIDKDDFLMPICDAVEAVTGHRPHQVTGYRWTNTGCHGVVLRTSFIGQKRLTNINWVKQFLEELTKQNGKISKPQKPKVTAMKLAKGGK